MDAWSWVKQACNPRLQVFEASLANPQIAQAQLLQDIIHSNRDCEFGQQHRFADIDDYNGFADIDDYNGFADNVPIADYEAFQTAITAIENGETNLLTTADVIQFEETGGSTSGAKRIPYTDAVLSAFQRAILPWLGDLLHHRPNICRGRVFFMISPALRPPSTTAGGIPIGSGDDLGYFGQAVAPHLAQVTLYSPQLLQPQPAEQWKYHAALLLLQAEDLSLMSLWSPTLLLELLDFIITKKSELLPEIADKNRRATLDNAIGNDHINTAEVWALLDTISCWDSHTAAVHADKLQQQFPHVFIQGKGLLATEAVTTLPYSKTKQPILAVNSHFYEFMDSNKRVFLAHQLTRGKTYRVILTTQAGLYRYDSGDRVIVDDFYQATPTLSFIGRDSLISDLCGEKLSETFVGQAIAHINPQLVGQSLLVAVNSDKPHYRWLIAHPVNDRDTAKLCQQLDDNLKHNPQYRYAREMGQLGTIRIEYCRDIHAYYQQQHKGNKRLSTIKLPTLLPHRDIN